VTGTGFWITLQKVANDFTERWLRCALVQSFMSILYTQGGSATCERGKEQGAKRIEIGGNTGGFASQDLGGHESCCSCCLRRGLDARKIEIEQTHGGQAVDLPRGDPHVIGGNITMNPTPGVQVC